MIIIIESVFLLDIPIISINLIISNFKEKDIYYLET